MKCIGLERCFESGINDPHKHASKLRGFNFTLITNTVGYFMESKPGLQKWHAVLVTTHQENHDILHICVERCQKQLFCEDFTLMLTFLLLLYVSEPECGVYLDLTATHIFDAFVSLHSGIKQIYLPFAGKWRSIIGQRYPCDA